MFRCLDIVDPLNIDAGPILQLEHEVRSVVKRDGTKYKSCPFVDIPSECVVFLKKKKKNDTKEEIIWNAICMLPFSKSRANIDCPVSCLPCRIGKRSPM